MSYTTVKVTATVEPELPPEQLVVKLAAPQLPYVLPARASNAVRAAAKLQVRSYALSSEPSLLLYCSLREPFEGVYVATTSTKPSAKVEMALVSVVNSSEPEA